MSKRAMTTDRVLECDGVSYRIRQQTATDEDMGFEIRFPQAPSGMLSTETATKLYEELRGRREDVDYDIFATQKMTDRELRGTIRFGWEMHERGRLGHPYAVIGTAEGVDP